MSPAAVRPEPGPALLALYDEALPQVYGYLIARCGRRALAEDLTAETFLAAVTWAPHDLGDGMATVLASEFRGHDVILTVDLGGDSAPITVRQHSVAPPAVDAKVRIHVTGAAVVFGDRSRDGR